MELARRFLLVAARHAPLAELEQSLEQILLAAHATWTSVSVADEVFVEHLARCVRDDEPILETLATLHTCDLFLACACVNGDRAAVAAFDEAFVARLQMGSKEGTGTFGSELKQALRERVLVGQPGARPRLATYSGRGPLSGWLKVAAARLAVDLRREQKSDARAAQRDVPLPPLDPELAYLKARYRVEFQDAIKEGFSALSPRELTLLRLHFLEQMPTSSIARMYRVSARSVQRWIAAAQSTVVEVVRRYLHARLTLSESELTSLLALVLSQLTLSLHQFLVDEPPA